MVWQFYDDEAYGVSGSPFLFYAIQYPSFPHRMFGGWNILSTDPQVMMNGCAVLLGGGEMQMDNGEAVMLSTLLATPGGMAFAEKVVSRLVDPNDRVIVFVDGECAGSAGSLREGSDAAEIGLQSIGAADGTVYLGYGSLLPYVHWSHRISSVGCTCVAASVCQSSRLELSILDTARTGGSIRDLLIDFAHRSYEDPEIIRREVSGYGLHACLGGLDSEDVVINMSDANTSRVHCAVREAAEESGIVLYDAGAVSELEMDPPDYYTCRPKWQALPLTWRRVS